MSDYDWRAELLEGLEALKEVIPQLPSLFVELRRKQRHHDVVCVVLRELLHSSDPMTRSIESCASEARGVADRLYPPPKAPT